jgi:hypothetical protein
MKTVLIGLKLGRNLMVRRSHNSFEESKTNRIRIINDIVDEWTESHDDNLADYETWNRFPKLLIYTLLYYIIIVPLI